MPIPHNPQSVGLIDMARCPKSDAGLCRRGGSFMYPARDLVGGL
jgi:hypothetical protein